MPASHQIQSYRDLHLISRLAGSVRLLYLIRYHGAGRFAGSALGYFGRASHSRSRLSAVTILPGGVFFFFFVNASTASKTALRSPTEAYKIRYSIRPTGALI